MVPEENSGRSQKPLKHRRNHKPGWSARNRGRESHGAFRAISRCDDRIRIVCGRAGIGHGALPGSDLGLRLHLQTGSRWLLHFGRSPSAASAKWDIHQREAGADAKGQLRQRPRPVDHVFRRHLRHGPVQAHAEWEIHRRIRARFRESSRNRNVANKLKPHSCSRRATSCA